MGDRESKMGEWEKQNRYIGLSSIREKQNRQKKSKNLVCQGPCRTKAHTGSYD